MPSHPQLAKTLPEIQRAHDLLLGVMLDEALRGSIGLSADQFADVTAYASALCWLLGHEHNPSFAANLAELEKKLRQQHGFLLHDRLDPGRGPVQ